LLISGSPDSSGSDRTTHRPPGINSLLLPIKSEFHNLSDSVIDPNASSEEMLKRINELNSLLEARETKLFELSKINVELQENNADLHRYYLKK